MKKFFSEHSYDMVKMFLNQFAISIFGVVLAFAAAKAESTALINATSIGAILFYLFLLYTMTWEIGYKDHVAVTQGRKLKRPFKGVLISLCANIPNLLFAIFILLDVLIENGVINTIGGICRFLAMLLEGSYVGVLSNTVGGLQLNEYTFVYFLLPIPAMLICGISYYLGLKDIKFTKLFYPSTPGADRDPSEKKGRRHRD